MSPEPTPLMTRYIAAMNVRDKVAFLECFTPGAIVHDEGRAYQGHEQIGLWLEKVWEVYQPHLELKEVLSIGPATIFIGQVSGTFDGSPLRLRHHLTVADDLITDLKIAP